jgi:hypothetical protein
MRHLSVSFFTVDMHSDMQLGVEQDIKVEVAGNTRTGIGVGLEPEGWGKRNDPQRTEAPEGKR